MKINPSENLHKKTPSFQSRNAEIRFADDILRRANQEFPRISTSRLIDTFYKKDISPAQKKYIISLNEAFKYTKRNIPNPVFKPDEYAKALLDFMKKYKAGNCGESATLGKIALAINGVESIKVGLYGYASKNISTNLDYAFNIVNLDKNADLSRYETFGKKAYVVNLWNCSVDYVHNAFKKFELEYAKDKRMPMIKTFGIKVRDFEISPETLKEIEHTFPNLKINKK